MYFHAQFHYNSRSEVAHTLHILNTKKRDSFHIFLGPIGLFWSIKQFEKKAWNKIMHDSKSWLPKFLELQFFNWNWQLIDKLCLASITTYQTGKSKLHWFENSEFLTPLCFWLGVQPPSRIMQFHCVLTVENPWRSCVSQWIIGGGWIASLSLFNESLYSSSQKKPF